MSSENLRVIAAKPASRAIPRLLRRLLVILAGVVVALSIVLVALLNWPAPAMPRPGLTGDFLVRDVAIVDVVNGEILAGRDVVVRGGRIESLGMSTAANGQGALTVVQGTGKFLIPGLWDMHFHSQKIAPQYDHPLSIANGITGVREMWGCAGLPDSFVPCHEDIERWRQGLRDRSQLAPRYIQRSSFAINGEGGGTPSATPAFFRTRSADDARVLVEHHATDGADLLKTYTELSLAGYHALAQEAPKHGLSLAGHLPVRVPLEVALAAGQRSIEHPRLFLFECFAGAAEFRALPNPLATYSTSLEMQARLVDEHDPERCTELMAAMAASDTWWTPTLQVLRMSALADNRDFREDARLRYIPYLIRAGLWKPDIDRWAERAAAHGQGRNLQAELYRLALDNVRQARAAGVKILAGTDSGDTHVFPGFAIHDELAELVAAGLAPADALRSATIEAARFTGTAQDYGSIEVGKVGDMILLDANPLTDIRSTGKIAGVFFNGQYLDRAALDELLNFAEQQANSVRANLQLLWAALKSPVVRANAAD